jgi:zinc transport system permease protein
VRRHPAGDPHPDIPDDVEIARPAGVRAGTDEECVG